MNQELENLQSSNDVLNVLSKAFLQAFDTVLGKPVMEGDVSNKVQDSFSLPVEMVAIVDFVGAAVGLFSVAVDEQTISNIMGKGDLPPVEERGNIREEHGDIIKEMLNSASGDCMKVISEVYSPVTALPPKIIYGTIVYPLVSCTQRKVCTEYGDFYFSVIIDHMKIDSNRLTKELQISNRKITELTENLQKLVDERTADLKESQEEAIKANAAKSDFLANMSHELRTPMNGVMGMIQMALDSDNERQRNKFLETASRSSEYLLEVINDILDITKIQAGKIEMENIDFDLKRLFKDVVDLVSVDAQLKGVEVNYDFHKDIPRCFNGDPGRIRQVLFNLIGNAVKFTIKGTIDIRVRKDSVLDGGIMVSVSDTGIGIAEDKLAQVFEKFKQASSSTSREYGGTGLGLSICRSLVEMMNGKIGVKSELNEGSTFWFTMELKVIDEELFELINSDMEADSLSKKIPAGVKVLLVEDNTVNQKITIKMLESFACEIECASDGAEAIRSFEKSDYDIILMDCMMPDIDGFEATKRIREIEKRRNQAMTPIVALTASAVRGNRNKCLSAGMDDYISKPLKKNVLWSAIAKWSNKCSV